MTVSRSRRIRFLIALHDEIDEDAFDLHVHSFAFLFRQVFYVYIGMWIISFRVFSLLVKSTPYRYFPSLPAVRIRPEKISYNRFHGIA